MTVYSYEAVSNMGKMVRSTYEANSQAEVLEMLRKKKLYPVKVEEGLSKTIKVPFAFQQIKTKDIAFFCRQVSALLNAGVPIADTLQIISRQIANKSLRKAVLEVSEEVQTGISFSEAMKKQEVFPDLLIYMVASGEVSGTLNSVMQRMADDYEKEYAMHKKISGAMVYPILIVIVAVFAVVFIVTSVLPRFVDMFAGAGVELPPVTKALINLSAFLQQSWLYLLIALAALVYGCFWFKRTPQGRLAVDIAKLSLPVLGGVNQKIVMARFTRTFSSLLKSGVPLIQAIEYVAAVVGNKFIGDKILAIREEIAKGSNLTDTVRKSNVFDPVVVYMLKIGEDSGKLDEVMESTAKIYDQEVEVAVQSLTSIIEPLMIILMAAVVGVIVFSIITPMFDIAKTVGG